MNPFIDYSQFSAYLKCPKLWYERQVNKRGRVWPNAFRDDALAIGSLVHSGLEVWQRDHRIEIPQAVIDEISPTPEALTMCRLMVLGYTRAFPAEHWPKILCEQPLRFPLLRSDKAQACPFCGWVSVDPILPHYTMDNIRYDMCPVCSSKITTCADGLNYDGLAKIDAWFEVPETTVIESGLPGEPCTLTPGIWIHEYKTKAASLSLAHFMMRWEVNRQASFQTLALQHELGHPIQGVLVNVIEKPRVYTPRRKCKGCEVQYELPAWLPGEAEASVCPGCGHSQVLSKGNTATTYGNPSYYRFAVYRSAETLEAHKAEIAAIAEKMSEAAVSGLTSLLTNSEACVDPRWGPCEYMIPHTYNGDTLEDPNFRILPDYVNEQASIVG